MATEINKPKKFLDTQPVDFLERLIGYEEANRMPADISKTFKESIIKEASKIVPIPPEQEITPAPSISAAPSFEIPEALSPEEKKQIFESRQRALTGQLATALPTDLSKIISVWGPKLEQKEKEIEQKREERRTKAASKFEETKRPEIQTGEILARSLIALAPALIGRAAAGSLGGYAGAQASVTALSELERMRQEQQKLQQKYAEEELQSATQFGKGELDKIQEIQKELVKAQLKAGTLPYETQLAAQLNALKELGPKELKAIEAKSQAERKKAELELKKWQESEDLKDKKWLESEKLKIEQQKNLTEKERIRKDYIYNELERVQKEKEKKLERSEKEKEKGSSDLGFGFYLKEGFTQKDREKAQDFVAKFGSVKPAMDELTASLKEADARRISKWTDLGSDFDAKANALATALIEYTNRGASLTANEKNLVESLGIRLESKGAFVDSLKSGFAPEKLAKRLKMVEGVLARQTAGKIKPYQGYLVEEPKVIPSAEKGLKVISGAVKKQEVTKPKSSPFAAEKQQAPKFTKEVYNKMTDQEKIEYKSASPERRSEIIKQVEGR